MKASRTIHSFLLSEQEGQTLLTAQERPWSVLQVIPTTPADFDCTVAALKKRGMIAHHDTDRTFCIIHLASGDHDGKHPERHIAITYYRRSARIATAQRPPRQGVAPGSSS